MSHEWTVLGIDISKAKLHVAPVVRKERQTLEKEYQASLQMSLPLKL